MQLKDSSVMMLQKPENLKQAQVKYAMAKGIRNPYDFRLALSQADDFNNWFSAHLQASQLYAGILKLTGEPEHDCDKFEYCDEMDTIVPYFDEEIRPISTYDFCKLPYYDSSLVLTQNPLEKKDLIRADFNCRNLVVGVFGLNDDMDKRDKLSYIADLAKYTSGATQEKISFDDYYVAYTVNHKTLGAMTIK